LLGGKPHSFPFVIIDKQAQYRTQKQRQEEDIVDLELGISKLVVAEERIRNAVTFLAGCRQLLWAFATK